MACESCKSCIRSFAKVILVIINAIALLVGLALIVLGSLTIAKGSEIDVGVNLTPAGIALIVLGVLMLLVGCFGCFGAITGKHGTLNVYLVVLGIIVLLEIALLIYGLVNKDTLEATIESALTDPFDDVNEQGANATEADLATVTNLQAQAHCCGLTGPDFWKPTTFGVGKVPKSCCEESDQTEGVETCAKTDAYPDGCLESSEEIVQKVISLMIIVIVLIVIFQIICMILACCSKGEYEEVSNA